ncbi:MAG: toll/interleukin-1 receptor domain-containing protein [Comamonadaceae bacterium]|nr:toll/interleukin-1 receptor domain-containing protein [Comamonadaceae bacterium]
MFCDLHRPKSPTWQDDHTLGSFTMKVFLSYASEQHDTVEAVQLGLVGLGHEVFFDREALSGGANYLSGIANAIQACDAFSVLHLARVSRFGALHVERTRLGEAQVVASPEARNSGLGGSDAVFGHTDVPESGHRARTQGEHRCRRGSRSAVRRAWVGGIVEADNP